MSEVSSWSNTDAGNNLTPPDGWPTYEISLTARVSADTVKYEICNESGVNQNFGTSPPVRFLVIR